MTKREAKGRAVYFAMYPTDFLADVGHLGNTELGIYWRLLLVYYRDGRPLPFDQDRIRRLALAFSPEEAKAVDTVVSEFFVLSTEADGARVWRHARADREIAAADSARELRIQKTKAASEARWKPKQSMDFSVTESVTESVTSPLRGENQNQNQNQSLVDRKREDQRGIGVPDSGPTAPADGEAAGQPTDAGGKIPNCPAEEVIALYHAHLPSLPRCMVLTDARQRAIRARWRAWAAMDGWEHQSDGLDAFRAFFKAVAESPFLMGKVPGRDGRPPFTASLDWLMSPTNWLKVYEGAYAKKRGVTR